MSESDGALGIIAPCVSSEIVGGSTGGEGTSRGVIMSGRCRVQAREGCSENNAKWGV